MFSRIDMDIISLSLSDSFLILKLKAVHDNANCWQVEENICGQVGSTEFVTGCRGSVRVRREAKYRGSRKDRSECSRQGRDRGKREKLGNLVGERTGQSHGVEESTSREPAFRSSVAARCVDCREAKERKSPRRNTFTSTFFFCYLFYNTHMCGCRLYERYLSTSNLSIKPR